MGHFVRTSFMNNPKVKHQEKKTHQQLFQPSREAHDETKRTSWVTGQNGSGQNSTNILCTF